MISSRKVLFLVGPTAVGKSAAAMQLAPALNARIISCDAMQVYREVVIASDKPSAGMCRCIPHYLIDVVSVKEDFNAARYRALAAAAIDETLAAGAMPLVVGGSGMYMMALLDGLFDGGEADPLLRARLEGYADDDLYAALKAADPAAAAKIAPGDKKRIVRALEVLETTGMPMSAQQKKRSGIWGKYDIRIIGLERPRAELYARAEARIDVMFDAGLVEEVRGLCAGGLSATASRIIGVPEVKGYLDGQYDLDRARYLMKLHTRHYIKRQMTWFRKDKRIEWLTIGHDEGAKAVADKIAAMI